MYGAEHSLPSSASFYCNQTSIIQGGDTHFIKMPDTLRLCSSTCPGIFDAQNSTVMKLNGLLESMLLVDVENLPMLCGIHDII